MAPKKNKKSNKLARMSDEEKLRYLQHRAAIEEETKRRKEQLVATYLKSKLKKEEAFTRLNTAKLNQQWRHNLRQIKCKELKDEMMTMENRFQILLDCKNDHIDMLLRDLEDAEEQNLKQYGAHAEIVSQFLSIHEKSLQELHARYEHKKQLLLDELKHNFRWMRDIFSRDDERLDLMSIIFEARNDDDTQQIHINFEDSIAVLNNEMLFEKDRFTKIRFAEIQTTMKKFQKVLDDYSNETESKKNHYNYLKMRDEANTASIEENNKRIHAYSEEIKMLTQLCAKREAQYAQRENELKRDREDLIKRGFVAQNQLNVNRNEYKNKLEAMTKVYKNVIDKLTNISKKGERIIKTAENCAKLMNEDDNNLICLDEDNDEGEFDKMSKFWKRYARADVQCQELDVRRTKAAQENKDLKAALTYYLKTIARPASVQRDIKDGGIQLNLLPVKAG
ncbi:dynein regulatory complex subunit 2-like isoform X2 [Acyrthosiphon pisum]|uniref:Dynein regulatory complex subunit 2 n=1 Tax=Acyrthosiphon pisum TaxID=7029 RepID=A0A8R1W5I4_ACYPI|nr:dynein regulatory complex subunit 2-like isoform X2 [Acyrthosiphon pisum]|eukprot:XP_003244887.1 PREDICTED: coiled-coil domain-containing protein 65-like isoform X2 [Acyrthosiphon pisum]